MKDVIESFIAIRNLALMNCLIGMNLPLFTIKMLKVFNGENPQILNEIFRIRDEASYEPRQKSCFHIPSVNTVFRVGEISGPRSFSVRKSGTYIK